MEDLEVRATATVRFVLPGNGLGLQFKAIRQEDPWNGAIEDLVRVRIVEPPYFPHLEAIEVERPGKSTTDLYIFRRPLPRNGADAIFLECPGCRGLRRALYGWSAGGATTRSVFLSQWQCRECARLRYASEGGALLVRSRGFLGKILGVARAPRPKPWYPSVLTARSLNYANIADTLMAG